MKTKFYRIGWVTLLVTIALVLSANTSNTASAYNVAHQNAVSTVPSQVVSETLKFSLPITFTDDQIGLGMAKWVNMIFAALNRVSDLSEKQAQINLAVQGRLDAQDQWNESQFKLVDEGQNAEIAALRADLYAFTSTMTSTHASGPVIGGGGAGGGSFDPSTLLSLDGLEFGKDYVPTQGVTLTWTGVGRICRYVATIAAVVPPYTTLDMGGWKYLGGDAVPQGYGTYFDCDKWQQFVPVNLGPDADAGGGDLGGGDTADFCDATALGIYPGVASVKALDSVNAQYLLTFSVTGVFTVPIGSDLDYDTVKYGRTGAGGPTADVTKGSTATLWGPACMKPQ